jgi:hypothetical protein
VGSAAGANAAHLGAAQRRCIPVVDRQAQLRRQRHVVPSEFGAHWETDPAHKGGKLGGRARAQCTCVCRWPRTALEAAGDTQVCAAASAGRGRAAAGRQTRSACAAARTRYCCPAMSPAAWTGASGARRAAMLPVDAGPARDRTPQRRAALAPRPAAACGRPVGPAGHQPVMRSAPMSVATTFDSL